MLTIDTVRLIFSRKNNSSYYYYYSFAFRARWSQKLLGLELWNLEYVLGLEGEREIYQIFSGQACPLRAPAPKGLYMAQCKIFIFWYFDMKIMFWGFWVTLWKMAVVKNSKWGSNSRCHQNLAQGRTLLWYLYMAEMQFYNPQFSVIFDFQFSVIWSENWVLGVLRDAKKYGCGKNVKMKLNFKIATNATKILIRE